MKTLSGALLAGALVPALTWTYIAVKQYLGFNSWAAATCAVVAVLVVSWALHKVYEHNGSH